MSAGLSGPYKISRVNDVIYASPGDKPLLADLYLPDLPNAAARQLPVIVWLHGGGWRFGDRKLGPDLGRFFAEQGFAMVSLDYRLSGEAIFPAAVIDVKTGVRWLRSVAASYSLDATRIGLWGSSSGGHLAALAALSGRGLFEDAKSSYAAYSSAVQAVVEAYAPIDFLQMDEHRDPLDRPSDDPESIQLPPGKRSADADSLESLFLGAPIKTCPELVRQANPVAHVSSGAPPFLILHGLSDTAVPAHQSELLFQTLGSAGNDVTLCLVEGLGHGFLNRNHFDQGPPRGVTVRRWLAGKRKPNAAKPCLTFGVTSAFRLVQKNAMRQRRRFILPEEQHDEQLETTYISWRGRRGRGGGIRLAEVQF